MSASIYINDEYRTVRIECDDDGPRMTIRASAIDDDNSEFWYAEYSVSLELSPKSLDALEAAIKAARIHMARADYDEEMAA